MKSLKHLLFICFLALLVACSEDAIVPQSEVVPTGEGGSVDYISMTVPDIEIADAMTRSKLIDDDTELKFVWQEDDAIGVVPMTGRPLSFPIHAENIQKNTAVFDGGGWALKTSEKYAAFFPYKKDNYERDIKTLSLDYTGQTSSNFMDYDYMATGAMKPKDGAVKFTMQRLSAILKIKVYINSGMTTRYCSLTASDEVFGIKGTLDLSGTNPVYTPTVKSKTINLDFELDKDSRGEFFTFYIMLPPTDLDGKLLTLVFNSDDGTAQRTTFRGKNFEAGKAYYVDAGSLDDAYIHNAKLIEAAGLSAVAVNGNVNVRTNHERILQVTSIDVSEKNDPTVCDEIGYFINLEELYCNDNDITSLDVSNNNKLTKLHCYNNELSSLCLLNNPELTQLRCYSNYLSSLDVSYNPKLVELSCNSNQLTSLVVSNNRMLTSLNCSSNKLTSLDVSKSVYLEQLFCYSNRLTSLNVSNNTMLGNLMCYSNQLTSLDLSNNTLLIWLECNSNQLTSLNLSSNPYIYYLECSSNQLTSLDLSNSQSMYYLMCSSNQLSSLDVSQCTVMSELYCDNNKLTSLDVSNNTALNKLYCSNNQLATLNVDKNKNLNILYCGGSNKITSLTIDTSINGIGLSVLDVSGCTSLDELNCYPSDYASGGIGLLTSLNVNGCTKLSLLNCGWNQLESLNLSTNTELYWGLTCHNNLLKTVDITKCTKLPLTRVYCGSQWTDRSKTTQQSMTLYYTSQNTGTFNGSSTNNSGVTLVKQ